MEYKMKIAGLDRALPLCPISDSVYIGAFIMLGDVELTVACASELLKRCPECDILVTAECKGIPLAYEMSRQSGLKYLVVRKGIKAYMQEPFSVEVNSITTQHTQTLTIDKVDAEAIRGKRVVIVDDVISTGKSLLAVEELVNRAGGNIVGRMAVLAEGDAQERADIAYLEKLPIFNSKGEIIG